MGYFEAAAAADEEDIIGERDFVLDESPADDFVDGVVAADVFTGDDEFASAGEKAGGVKTASAIEDALGAAEFFGELQKRGGGDLEGTGLRGSAEEFGTNLVDGRFAADAAAGVDVEVAASGGIEKGGGAELDVHGIFCLCRCSSSGGLGFLNRKNLIGCLDYAFGEEEAGGQLSVMAGSAHGDGERFAVNANFERLFAGERVLEAARMAIRVFGDLS